MSIPGPKAATTHASSSAFQPNHADGSVTAAGTPSANYDYGLPDAAVAQCPAEPRSSARLMVQPGLEVPGLPQRPTMADLPRLLAPGDVVVVNDTTVLAARLALTKATGGQAEVLLLEPDPHTTVGSTSEPGSTWRALVRPGRRLPPGTELHESDPEGRLGPAVVVVGESDPEDESGARTVRLLDRTVIDRAGVMPLPPYIHRTLDDPARYQTVYSTHRAMEDRSVAAPTAGLHFTPELLHACLEAGATVARVDLAIGIDTFRPVTTETVEEHVIHTERYAVPPETVAACRRANRVVAIGTTAVRALESAAATGALSGRTDLFIHGEFPFRVVDVLVTNFHLPRSSLLLLVESFCGPEWRDLYATALADGYRFLSFGDAMITARKRPKVPPRWSVEA